MTTDFRALCVDLLEEIISMWRRSEVNRNDDLINRAIDALAEPLPEPTVKTEELPMAEPLLEGNLTMLVGNLTMPFMSIKADCVRRKLPEAVRLVTTEGHNGNDIYALQGFFAWKQGAEFGGEWRLLETQDELFAKDDIPYGLLP